MYSADIKLFTHAQYIQCINTNLSIMCYTKTGHQPYMAHGMDFAQYWLKQFKLLRLHLSDQFITPFPMVYMRGKFKVSTAFQPL